MTTVEKQVTEKPIRIDFNTHTRDIEEVYEISPDGVKVRTDDGWVSSYRPNIIVQRPVHVPGFITADQIEDAIQFEHNVMKDKKCKNLACGIVARKYPIRKWLKTGE